MKVQVSGEAKQQANNRSTNVNITIDGVTQTISKWAKQSGVSHTTIKRRLNNGIVGTDLLKPTGESKWR
jgi:hypothetical protein